MLCGDNHSTAQRPFRLFILKKRWSPGSALPNEDPRYKHSGVTYSLGQTHQPDLTQRAKGPTVRGPQSTTPHPPRPPRGRRETETPRAALPSGMGPEKRRRRGKVGVFPNDRNDRTRQPRSPAQRVFATFWPTKSRTLLLICLCQEKTRIIKKSGATCTVETHAKRTNPYSGNRSRMTSSASCHGVQAPASESRRDDCSFNPPGVAASWEC